jgi:hypothetical protein
MRPDERGCPVQGGVALVEDRCERLEHVWDFGGDVEDGGDVVTGGLDG